MLGPLLPHWGAPAEAEVMMGKGHGEEQKVSGDPAGCSKNTDISSSQDNPTVFMLEAGPIPAGDKSP